jgi:hypothetical protein
MLFLQEIFSLKYYLEQGNQSGYRERSMDNLMLVYISYLVFLFFILLSYWLAHDKYAKQKKYFIERSDD